VTNRSEVRKQVRAQVNFNGPGNIMAFLENCYLIKTLPNLNLPDLFSIPYPMPAGGSPFLALPGPLYSFLNQVTCCQIINSEIYQNLLKNILGPRKTPCAQV